MGRLPRAYTGRGALGSRWLPVPPGGDLSEGDKRDSKGDMPGEVGFRAGPMTTEAVARQRRLCSGASVGDSAPEVLARSLPPLSRVGESADSWAQRLVGGRNSLWVGWSRLPGQFAQMVRSPNPTTLITVSGPLERESTTHWKHGCFLFLDKGGLLGGGFVPRWHDD